MTGRFFGEYLVQRGIIKPETLVSALIEQMKNLPIVSQIVFENKWISSESLIQVFHQQQVKGEDFISSCKSLGLWNEKLSFAVEECLIKERIPVGQILVQRSDIDIKTLTKLLDDFLAQAEVHSSPVEPTSAVKADAVAMAHERIDIGPIEVISGETPETNEEVYQPGIIAELEDMFDERKRRALKVALGFIKDKSQPDAPMMTKLMQDSLKIIRAILELVKLFGITSMQNIFQEMERVLESRMNVSAFTPKQMQNLAIVVSSAMEEAWVLRQSLAAHCTDRMYFQDSNAKVRFEKIIQELKDFQ